MSWLSILPTDILKLLNSYIIGNKLIIEIDDFSNCRKNYTGCCLRLKMSHVTFVLKSLYSERSICFKDVVLHCRELYDFLDFHRNNENYSDPTPEKYKDYPIKNNVLDFYDWALVHSSNSFKLVIFDYKCESFTVNCQPKKIIECVQFDEEFLGEIWRQLIELKKTFDCITLIDHVSTA